MSQYIPDEAFKEARAGRCVVPLIANSVIEWQYPNRVMRQFGMRQRLPIADPENIDNLRKKNLRGNYDKDWYYEHYEFVVKWDSGIHRRVKGDSINDPMFFVNSQQYSDWFVSAGLPHFWPDEQYPVIYRPSRSEGGRMCVCTKIG